MVLLLLILLPVLAGCTSPPPVQRLAIGTPTIGDRVVYEGSDGGTVAVTVVGEATRADGGQHLHEALILRYEVTRTLVRSRSWTVEEAVEKETGLHVRHDALDVLKDETTEAPPQDEIYFLTYGLPGGLGLAPYWGGWLHAGEHPAPTALGGRLMATPLAVEEYGRSCMEVAAVDRHFLVQGSWIPITAALGPNIVCDGDFLPTAWTSDIGYQNRRDRVVYEAVRRETVTPSWQRIDSRNPLNVTREATSGPLSLLVGRPTITGFASETAHQKALELDPGYGSFLRGNGTHLVDAHFTSGAQGGTTLGEKRYSSYWELTLAQPNGNGYKVTIEQIRHEPLLGAEYTTYELTEAGLVEWDDPPPDAAFSGTSGTFVYDFGQDVTGGLPFAASHLTTTRQALFTSERTTLEDRFRVGVFFFPGAGASSGVMGLVAPWIFYGDSKTGWLTHVRLSPELRPMI